MNKCPYMVQKLHSQAGSEEVVDLALVADVVVARWAPRFFFLFCFMKYMFAIVGNEEVNKVNVIFLNHGLA